MTNNLVLIQFVREKRLSNAQGRGLCEANAGHAPRKMVSWGRGIAGDPDAIVLMTVSEAFLIFVDDILSLYLQAAPYNFTGIEQLLQICIYMLFRAVTLV